LDQDSTQALPGLGNFSMDMISVEASDLYTKKEVVVMEDDATAQSVIKQVMESLSWQVRIVDNRQDAVALARQKYAGFYILDINMGRDRTQEGLDALEQIKEIDRQIFVSIFSGYPSPQAETMASNLEADEFRSKSSDLKKDIQAIARKMLQRRHQRAVEIKEEVEDQLKAIDAQVTDPTPIDFLSELDQAADSQASSAPWFQTDLESDENILAFETLRADEHWRQAHLNQYVALADGKLIKYQPDKASLLQWLYSSPISQTTPIFVAKVEAEKDEEIIELPSSLWTDEIP
jgi:ActR/RegA family two-component response regulator